MKGSLWHAYSNIGLYSIQGAPLVIAFVIPSGRTRCAYYFAAFLLLMVIQNITKLSYHDPRPFWVSPDVNALSCSSQFGNPSGHSENAIAMSLLLWLDLVYRSDKPRCTKITVLILALLFPISIGYSRLLLGVHSLD
jgi:membrane-associated phospholipid phosphatase